MQCLPLLVGLITLAVEVRMPTGGEGGGGGIGSEGRIEFWSGRRVEVWISFLCWALVAQIANVGWCWSGVLYRKGRKSLIVIDWIGGWGLGIGGWG